MRETEAQVAQLYAALDKASAEIGRLEAQLDAERVARTKAEAVLNRLREWGARYRGDDINIASFVGEVLDEIESAQLLADTEEPR